MTPLPAWTVLDHPVPPPLRGHVLRMTGYAEHAMPPLERSEMPSCAVPLILVLDDAFDLRGAGARRLARPFAAGLHLSATTIGSAGRAMCLQIDVTPMAARRILGCDMADLTGRVVDLDALPGRGLADLTRAVQAAPDWPTRFRLATAHVVGRLCDTAPADPRVMGAWRMIAAGAPRVGDLTDRLDVSRKHLSHLFRRDIGLPPRDLLRLARFDRVMRVLAGPARTNGPPLADLAAACGFADQAHMTREVRRMAGTSPAALCRHLLPDGGGIRAEPG